MNEGNMHERGMEDTVEYKLISVVFSYGWARADITLGSSACFPQPNNLRCHLDREAVTECLSNNNTAQCL